MTKNITGIVLVFARLGILGIVVTTAWWRSLDLSGVAISIVMLAIYLHPFHGIGARIVLVAAILWEQWPLLERLGL